VNTFIKTVYAALVYAFLYFPLVVMGVYSFNASKYSIAWKGFSTTWYLKLLGNTQLLDAALHSLTIAFFSEPWPPLSEPLQLWPCTATVSPGEKSCTDSCMS